MKAVYIWLINGVRRILTIVAVVSGLFWLLASLYGDKPYQFVLGWLGLCSFVLSALVYICAAVLTHQASLEQAEVDRVQEITDYLTKVSESHTPKTPIRKEGKVRRESNRQHFEYLRSKRYSPYSRYSRVLKGK